VLDGRSHALRPGTAFLYGPGVPQVITTHPQKRLKKYFVDFFGKEAAGLLRQLRLRPGEVRWVEEAAVVQTLFDELIREGQRGGAELCDAYLRVLLHKVAKQLPDAQPNRTAAYVSWRRCQEIVETDFHRLRGLRELSERTRLHPSHLCRLYKQFGNRSPHADITRRKLNHAAMLLMTAAAPVKAVALQVGYEDPLHFSRLFRRHFGRSPLAFRRAENRTKPFADASTGST
jgi:AraC-like DNA-binding protein